MGCLISKSDDIPISKPLIQYQNSYLQSLMKTNKFYIPFVYAISNNNRHIAICNYNRKIDIFDDNFEKIKSITTSNTVHSLIFNSNDKQIIYGTDNGIVFLKDIDSNSVVKRFSNNNNNSIVTKIVLSKCRLYLGYLLSITNPNGTKRYKQCLFHIDSESLVNQFDSKSQKLDLYFTNDSQNIIFINPKGTPIRADIVGNEINMISLKTIKCLSSIRLLTSSPSAFGFITFNGVLYYASFLENKKFLQKKLHSGLCHVTLLCISNLNEENENYISFGSEDGILYLLDTKNKNNLRLISNNSHVNIIDIKFSLDSKRLLVTYFKFPDTILCMYNCSIGKLISKIIIKREIKKDIPSKEESSDAPQQECVICMENRNDYAYVKCGHKCVCHDCGSQCKFCPICRKESAIIKIF